MSGINFPIEMGYEVAIYFTLSLTDGTVADELREGDPMRFTLGDGTLVQGLEYCLLGMRTGEQQSISLEPREAFGYPEQGRLHDLPRDRFTDKMALEPGTVMEFTNDADEAMAGTIKAVGENTVTVDFNHPLAGQEVIFDVEIIDVVPPMPDGE